MKLPINTPRKEVCGCITHHYHKDGLPNFLGGGSSKILAPCIIQVYEITD